MILKELKRNHPEYVFPRSATTRERRPGEGDDLYHFVSENEFTKWIDEGRFLEWAQVHKGARYGTLLSAILPPIEQGKIVIREVDVQGFESLRMHPQFSGKNPAYRLQTIFILPEDVSQLIARITKRAPISDDELKRRMESMNDELAKASLTDHQIANRQGKLKETIGEVENAIAG